MPHFKNIWYPCSVCYIWNTVTALLCHQTAIFSIFWAVSCLYDSDSEGWKEGRESRDGMQQMTSLHYTGTPRQPFLKGNWTESERLRACQSRWASLTKKVILQIWQNTGLAGLSLHWLVGLCDFGVWKGSFWFTITQTNSPIEAAVDQQLLYSAR